MSAEVLIEEYEVLESIFPEELTSTRLCRAPIPPVKSDGIPNYRSHLRTQ